MLLKTLGLLLLLIGSAQAATLDDNRGDTPFHIRVVSMAEARFHGVVRQQWDFSCGAAALATLLTYHLNRPADERTVFTGMWEHGDHAKIQAEGFSLYDMKVWLASQGIGSDGYRVSLDQLREVGVPVIVLLNLGGYMHFVVVKGVLGDRVLVGDPASGLHSYDRDRFQDMWNGIVFAVNSADTPALRRRFNRPEDWRVVPRASWGQAIDLPSLAVSTLSRHDANHF